MTLGGVFCTDVLLRNDSLTIKNYKRAFEFVKVIIRNIVSFFYLGYSKNGIFDDFIITSTLHSDA